MKRNYNNIAAKLVLVALILIGLQSTSKAQQIWQFSQFMENDYVMNPGVAGSKDYFDVKAMNRYQWTGVTDAPRTFTLSVNGPLKNRHIGLGGYLYTDNVGPTRRTGVQFSYTYQLFLSEDLKLGLGASVGVLQYMIDGTQIQLAEEDPVLMGTLENDLVFDAKFGAFLKGSNFWAGITLPQLMQTKLNVFDTPEINEFNRLEDHYLLFGGYEYPINDEFKLEGSALIKYVAPTPVKWDVAVRGFYREMIYLGASYRHNDAFVAMGGYRFRESLSIGYSYDFTTTDIKNYSDGTHEIVLGFRFNQ